MEPQSTDGRQGQDPPLHPEVTPDAEWKTYSVTLQPGDRVLDALHKIKWEQDAP